MAKKKEPTYWSDADPSVWVTPETKAKYWAQLIGRVESYDAKKRTASVKFEYNLLGTKLKEPESMTFPVARLLVVEDFFARIRRHVVHKPPPVEVEEYEVLSASDTLLESTGYDGAKDVPDGRVFHCVKEGALYTKDISAKKPVFEVWGLASEVCAPADSLLMHYNGLAYAFLSVVKEKDLPTIEKPKAKFVPTAPPHPAVPNEHSRTLEDRGLVVLHQKSDDRIIIGKPDKSHAEEWKEVHDAPATVHMLIQGRYWMLVRELKPSDKRIR